MAKTPPTEYRTSAHAVALARRAALAADRQAIRDYRAAAAGTRKGYVRVHTVAALVCPRTGVQIGATVALFSGQLDWSEYVAPVRPLPPDVAGAVTLASSAVQLDMEA